MEPNVADYINMRLVNKSDVVISQLNTQENQLNDKRFYLNALIFFNICISHGTDVCIYFGA